MKNFRSILVASISSLVLAVPFVAIGTANAAAQPGRLQCNNNLVQIDQIAPIFNCDLTLDKQVSVNGGAFVEADTSNDASSAHIGDTVTWQITVTNNSTEGSVPQGVVFVSDILPTEVTLNSHTTTAGTLFDDGVNRVWQLPLNNNGPNLPATLTLTTTATTTGLVKNTAAFMREDHAGSGCPDGGCVYSDSDPSNDSNDAWVNIQTPPQVLGESTTAVSPDTGYGAPASNNLLIVTLLVTGLLGLALSRKLYEDQK